MRNEAGRVGTRRTRRGAHGIRPKKPYGDCVRRPDPRRLSLRSLDHTRRLLTLAFQARLRKYGLPFLRDRPVTIRGKHWTRVEDSILLKYKHEGPNALAARLSRSPRAIQKRLYNLPEQRENATDPRRRQPWSDADAKLMLDSYDEGYLTTYVAERLQRTTFKFWA